MFMGDYNHTIDAKGRIIVPSRLRESLGDTFVVTLGLEGCLFVYPNDEWNLFVEELKKLPGTKEARQLQRYFMAGAAECEVDKQGRILIPAKLREYAALDKDVVFLGMINKVEIWSKERFEQNNTFEGMDEIADKMAEYGLSF
ncbi:MAG: division/cell wall cluster transcriptional repressor MraZ [Lachnospiraceae bacterium]|nr:division/cell wall cluster transcriptional repressor MraZ [Lachnospiraceae bacterium]